MNESLISSITTAPLLKIVNTDGVALTDNSALYRKDIGQIWKTTTKDIALLEAGSKAWVVEVAKRLGRMFKQGHTGYISLDVLSYRKGLTEEAVAEEAEKLKSRSTLKRAVDLVAYQGTPCTMVYDYTKVGSPTKGVSFDVTSKRYMKDTIRNARIERPNILALAAAAGESK
jgi:hypothetical protein